MDVVFLDIDGVLNTHRSMVCGAVRLRTFDSIFSRHHPLDPDAVDALNHIWKSTGAVAVMSSTWRIGSEDAFLATIQHLYDYGVKMPILSRTPRLNGEPRGAEIQHWLDNHASAKVKRFVILDDDSDMAHLADRLVQCPTETGLSFDLANQAIAMLTASAKESA